MTLKLEVGKTYETRGGERVTITGYVEGAFCPFVSEWYSFTANGSYYGPGETSVLDLIREAPDENPALRLEVGKTYEDARGFQVTIRRNRGKYFDGYGALAGKQSLAYLEDGEAAGLPKGYALVRELVPGIDYFNPGPSRSEPVPCKHDACECSKEKFGFLMHERWCPEWYHPMTPTAALTQGTPEPAPDYMTDGDRRAMREKNNGL